MAYTLQPGLSMVDASSLPSERATDMFTVYPQPGALSGACSRVSTMEYGTAPYMAGKGAPGNLIEIDDDLRPRSTTQFRKILINPVDNNLFPVQDMSCIGPAPTMRYDPKSSRADVQNFMFSQRYK